MKYSSHNNRIFFSASNCLSSELGYSRAWVMSVLLLNAILS